MISQTSTRKWRYRVDKQSMPPDVVVRRLPLYARTLAYLQQEGVKSVSSQELGARINVTAAQIRKDLSYFGQLGKQGIGYKVDDLLEHINRILGLSQDWNVVLVGVGHLGQAIARYSGFSEKGIHIVGLFDTDPRKIGSELVGLTIHHVNTIPTVVREQNVRMAIVAVSAEQAQDVVDLLVKAGVEAILNYAPVIVQVPEGVWVRHIDPVSLLHSMTYYLAREAPFEKP
ncbi:MAG TPA: redox-sensing transcriptional repressor Rex [Herpetosiphonaceae bacterium]